MPEGDTIHRIANQLAPLVGETLECVTTQGLSRDVAGQTVASVAAHGKHLVVELEDGAQLRVHLGMTGRFRRYARPDGEAALARMSPGRASLALVTPTAVYLWVQAKTVEVSHRRSPMRGLAVAALGPDILADDFDSRQAAARAAQHGSRIIADVLLDQRVVAGIGNIFKCESLWQCGIAPRTPTGALAEGRLAELYTAARTLMQQRLGDAPRQARDALAPSEPIPSDRYAVYARGGRPCSRCSKLIQCVQLGEPARWTWWCPQCQSLGGVDC